MIRLFKKTYTMKQNDEEKYVDLFKQIKISEGFYFSYTYDLTHTLQNNILKQVKKTNKLSNSNELNQNAQFYQDAEESSDSEDEGNSNYNCRLRLGTRLIKGQNIVQTTSGAANNWGLVNYVGNADEIVLDGSNPVLAGGNFTDSISDCKTTLKKEFKTENDYAGFRLVRYLRK